MMFGTTAPGVVSVSSISGPLKHDKSCKHFTYVVVIPRPNIAETGATSW